ncbi:MAG: dihydroorotate dehydrogenase electron transfer subunit [Actinomycetota bacterium]
MTPVLVQAQVVRAHPVGSYHLLALRAPEVAAAAVPGQFVSIAPPPSAASILRRPFSVYATSGPEVSIVFDAVGPTTGWLARRAPGDVVDLEGPLGHGFDLPEGHGDDVLVGGGYGTAALSMLGTVLRQRGRRVRAVIGARTSARLLDDPVLRAVTESVEVTTEDGSAGRRGRVTDVLGDLISGGNSGTVFACGPMGMLRAVATEARDSGVPCQIAVEEFMACGIGVCWTCVVPVRADEGVRHARGCSEGPVFDAERVVWQ